jgi:hypothetical protein
MRLREFSTPKSALKPVLRDADAIKAKAIKRQQQKLTDRDAQLNVQNTQKQLAQ